MESIKTVGLKTICNTINESPHVCRNLQRFTGSPWPCGAAENIHLAPGRWHAAHTQKNSMTSPWTLSASGGESKTQARPEEVLRSWALQILLQDLLYHCGHAQALSASFLFQLDAKYADLRVHTAAAQHMKKALTPIACSAARTNAAKHMSVRQLDVGRARASRLGLRNTGAISDSTARCCGTSVPFPVEMFPACILAARTTRQLTLK